MTRTTSCAIRSGPVCYCCSKRIFQVCRRGAMLHSILPALDDSVSSRAAEGFAVSVAGRCGAEISASVILDEPWLRGPGGTYHDAATRQRRNDAWNNVHHIGSSFQNLAQAAHITCAVSTAAEAPGPLLARRGNFDEIRNFDQRTKSQVPTLKRFSVSEPKQSSHRWMADGPAASLEGARQINLRRAGR